MSLDDLASSDMPDHVRELCLGCVQYVQRATGVTLDLTPETLPLLDHYLDQVRAAKADVKDLVAPAAGAYFGELVRGLYPARWHAPEGDLGGWRLEFERCFLHFNPVAFAREAIDREDSTEGGAGFGVASDDVDTLRAALEVFGDVDRDDYYRLTTRLEVLGPLVDRLTANALARDEASLDFNHDLYRRVLDEEPTGPAS